MESGKEERTIGTSETASLERKAIGEFQIPLRPSFSLHVSTLIKALRRYAYDKIYNGCALIMPSRMHAP